MTEVASNVIVYVSVEVQPVAERVPISWVASELSALVIVGVVVQPRTVRGVAPGLSFIGLLNVSCTLEAALTEPDSGFQLTKAGIVGYVLGATVLGLFGVVVVVVVVSSAKTEMLGLKFELDFSVVEESHSGMDAGVLSAGAGVSASEGVSAGATWSAARRGTDESTEEEAVAPTSIFPVLLILAAWEIVRFWSNELASFWHPAKRERRVIFPAI